MLVHPLLGLDDEHDSLVHHSIRPPSHGHPLMDVETYLSHHQLPLVHRGRPCEGATMWKINVYIYIYIYYYYFIHVYLCIFLSLSFFFFATCRILIRCHSRRSVSSRWEPRVILGLVCVASSAQVSSLYIVEFPRYPLHSQNLLL